MVVAVAHWGEVKLARAEANSQQGSKASDRAQVWNRAAEAIRPLSHAFRRDLERFGSVRHAFTTITDRFVDRLAGLIEEAAGSAAKFGPINARFAAEFIRYSSAAVRDESLLERAGLSAAEGMLAFDTNSILGRSSAPS